MDIQNEICRLADKIGVKLCFEEDPRDSYMWDGHIFRLKNITPSNTLHELAHWLVATPEQRGWIDFGLSAGPESGIDTKRKMPVSVCQTYEEEASLLGIAYEAYLGLPFVKTLDLHEWISLCSDGLFWAVIKRLTNKGLLENHLPKIR